MSAEFKITPVLLNVGYAVHDKDWNWQDVQSPFTRIYYVTSGSARVKLPSGVVDLLPGNLYIIPAYTLHSDICDGHFEHYYVHYYEEPMSEIQLFEDWTFPTMVPGTLMDRLLMERLCEMNPQLKLPQSDPTSYTNQHSILNSIKYNTRKSFGDRVEAQGIAMQLISRFIRVGKPKLDVDDSRIQVVLAFIRKHLMEDLSLDILACKANLSKDHFIRIFKRETGQTPSSYIVNRRIEYAQLLLATEDMSVKTIALQLGFEDNSYFNRVFKKITGLSPQQYRNQLFNKRQSK